MMFFQMLVTSYIGFKLLLFWKGISIQACVLLFLTNIPSDSTSSVMRVVPFPFIFAVKKNVVFNLSNRIPVVWLSW